MFLKILKEQVDKIDPVEGIISDIEVTCDCTEDGLVDKDALVGFMEGVHWLEASKEAIMTIIDMHTDEERKVNYRKALHEIVQD